MLLENPSNTHILRQACFMAPTCMCMSTLTKLALGLLGCTRHLYLGNLKEVFDFSFIQSAHVVNVGLNENMT